MIDISYIGCSEVRNEIDSSFETSVFSRELKPCVKWGNLLAPRPQRVKEKQKIVISYLTIVWSK